jgi:hypothetical protein
MADPLPLSNFGTFSTKCAMHQKIIWPKAVLVWHLKILAELTLKEEEKCFKN